MVDRDFPRSRDDPDHSEIRYQILYSNVTIFDTDCTLRHAPKPNGTPKQESQNGKNPYLQAEEGCLYRSDLLATLPKIDTSNLLSIGPLAADISSKIFQALSSPGVSMLPEYQKYHWGGRAGGKQENGDRRVSGANPSFV